VLPAHQHHHPHLLLDECNAGIAAQQVEQIGHEADTYDRHARIVRGLKRSKVYLQSRWRLVGVADPRWEAGDQVVNVCPLPMIGPSRPRRGRRVANGSVVLPYGHIALIVPIDGRDRTYARFQRRVVHDSEEGGLAGISEGVSDTQRANIVNIDGHVSVEDDRRDDRPSQAGVDEDERHALLCAPPMSPPAATATMKSTVCLFKSGAAAGAAAPTGSAAGGAGEQSSGAGKKKSKSKAKRKAGNGTENERDAKRRAAGSSE